MSQTPKQSVDWGMTRRRQPKSPLQRAMSSVKGAFTPTKKLPKVKTNEELRIRGLWLVFSQLIFMQKLVDELHSCSKVKGEQPVLDTDTSIRLNLFSNAVNQIWHDVDSSNETLIDLHDRYTKQTQRADLSELTRNDAAEMMGNDKKVVDEHLIFPRALRMILLTRVRLEVLKLTVGRILLDSNSLQSQTIDCKKAIEHPEQVLKALSTVNEAFYNRLQSLQEQITLYDEYASSKGRYSMDEAVPASLKFIMEGRDKLQALCESWVFGEE